MQPFKWENRFIEDNITRDISTTSRYIKTHEAFMERTVSKEDTLFGSKSKFSFIEWPKIRPASTSKYAKRSIVWFLKKETFYRCVVINNFCWKKIDEISGSEESFILEF